jgi:dihydroorotate dehydrogenase electron transfer subunit
VEQERVELLFQVVGSGTRILSERQEGGTLDVLGPLGQGFTIAEDASSAVIIAGGIGIAPFPLLLRKLVERTERIIVLAGWRTASDVIVTELLEELGAEVKVATEDGSHGYKGLVTDLLIDVLEKDGLEQDPSTLYTCGPTPMLARVSEISAAHDLQCQVSLEEMMACGIGACAGCAVPRHTGSEGDGAYALVCRDGPVFDSQEVILS